MNLRATNPRVYCAVFTMILLAPIGCQEESSQQTAITTSVTAPASSGTRPAQDDAKMAQEAFEEGTRLGKKGEYETAAQAYSRAIDLNPGYTDAYTFRALTYLKLGNFDRAVMDLDKVIALDPTADSYRTRADVYARNGYLDKAIKDYDKLLELDPGSASGYRNRATAYGEKNDYQKAIGDITKAIEVEPNNPMWRYDRAILKANYGDYSAAMIDAEYALKLSGGEPDLRPGEERETSEINFNCMRLIADLERAGAKRSQ